MKKFIFSIILILTTTLTGCSSDTAQTTVSKTEYSDMIISCFSANNFSNKPVSKDDLKTILKAGANAPISNGSKSCHFVVVKNKEIKNQIVQGLPDSVVLIVVSAPMVNQVLGGSGELLSGLATENIYITAQALGLGAHIYTEPVSKINISLKDKVVLPNQYEAVTVIAIGNIENFAEAVSGATPRKSYNENVSYVN